MVMTVSGPHFYKVAAGMCLYFIASSLWSLAERKLLPKKKHLPHAEPATETAVKSETATPKVESSKRKSTRKSRKPPSRPVLPRPWTI